MTGELSTRINVLQGSEDSEPTRGASRGHSPIRVTIPTMTRRHSVVKPYDEHDNPNMSHDVDHMKSSTVDSDIKHSCTRRFRSRTLVRRYEARPILNSHGYIRARGEKTSRDPRIFTRRLRATCTPSELLFGNQRPVLTAGIMPTTPIDPQGLPHKRHMTSSIGLHGSTPGSDTQWNA